MPPDPSTDQVVKWILKGIGYTAAICGSLMVIGVFIKQVKAWLKPPLPIDCTNCPAFLKYKLQQDEAMEHRAITDQARADKQDRMIETLIEKLTRTKK
jgi:hypothetical protein